MEQSRAAMDGHVSYSRLACGRLSRPSVQRLLSERYCLACESRRRLRASVAAILSCKSLRTAHLDNVKDMATADKKVQQS